jgi:ABC-type phosphate transport system permease subunit
MKTVAAHPTPNIATINPAYLKIGSLFTLVASALALALGVTSLSLNSLDNFPVPVLAGVSILLLVLFYLARQGHKQIKRSMILFVILGLIVSVVIYFLPVYIQGLQINGIIHRSFFSALGLLVISIPACSYSLYYYLGATPRADDVSKYPFIIFPAALILAGFVWMIYLISSDGFTHINWKIIATPYAWQVWTEQVWQDGWPSLVSHNIMQGGMRNQILGTLELMGLTALISLPIGMGVGIFVHEYAGKISSGIIRFTITALRSISGIIFAIIALSLVLHWQGRPGWMRDIICGYYVNHNGELYPSKGSFLLAAGFISLLVIPLIAKATEEGLRSLPKDIWEGSLAIGASREYTLTHILIPWSLPNIITGLMIGCAEAAGCLTLILFIGGSGEWGLSPMNQVTSLAYFIFDCKFGKALGDAVPQLVGKYQFLGALILLIITMGLTVGALILKKSISRRYRGT